MKLNIPIIFVILFLLFILIFQSCEPHFVISKTDPAYVGNYKLIINREYIPDTMFQLVPYTIPFIQGLDRFPRVTLSVNIIPFVDTTLFFQEERDSVVIYCKTGLGQFSNPFSIDGITENLRIFSHVDTVSILNPFSIAHTDPVYLHPCSLSLNWDKTLSFDRTFMATWHYQGKVCTLSIFDPLIIIIDSLAMIVSVSVSDTTGNACDLMQKNINAIVQTPVLSCPSEVKVPMGEIIIPMQFVSELPVTDLFYQIDNAEPPFNKKATNQTNDTIKVTINEPTTKVFQIWVTNAVSASNICTTNVITYRPDTANPTIHLVDTTISNQILQHNAYECKVIVKDDIGIKETYFLTESLKIPAVQKSDSLWSGNITNIPLKQIYPIKGMVVDSFGKMDSVEFTLYYEPSNNPPQCNDTAISVEETQSITVDINAHDLDGDKMTWNIIDNLLYGKVDKESGEIGIGPEFIYSSNNLAAVTIESFSIIISDSTDNCTCNVSITIQAENEPPTVSPLIFSIEEDADWKSFDIVANDPEGGIIKWEKISDPLLGVLEIASDSITNTEEGRYKPYLNKFGTDTFKLRVIDELGTTSNAIAAIVTINAVNDTPAIDITSPQTGATFLFSNNMKIPISMQFFDQEGISQVTVIINNVQKKVYENLENSGTRTFEWDIPFAMSSFGNQEIKAIITDTENAKDTAASAITVGYSFISDSLTVRSILDENNLQNTTVGSVTKIGSHGRVIELDLHFKSINILPSVIGNLNKLEIFSINKNSLDVIPTTIGNLTELKTLSLGENNLTNIPSEIGNLISLENLGMSANRLKDLPESMSNLINLKYLYFGGNSIDIFPSFITNLTQLQLLIVNNNGIKTLPTTIENLKSLQQFECMDNEITVLPGSIVNLPNMQNLYFNNNKLTELPTDFGLLTNLLDLGLNANKLKFLPSSVVSITKLIDLRLDENYLSTEKNNDGSWKYDWQIWAETYDPDWDDWQNSSEIESNKHY